MGVLSGVGLIGLGLLLMALPLVKVIAMTIDREISLAEMAAYLAVLLGLMAVFVKSAMSGSSIAALLVLALYAGLCMLYSVLTRALTRREAGRQEDDEVGALLRTLESEPENAAVLERLGDIAFAHHQWATAADYYQRSKQLWSDQRLNHQLEEALRRKQLVESGNVLCPDCGAENPTGMRLCVKCGAALSARAELLEQSRSPEGKRLLLLVGGLSTIGVFLLVFAKAVPWYVVHTVFLLAVGGIALRVRSRRG